MDEEESINVPTPADDSYPTNNYSIKAPEDPVSFVTQQIEPSTPAPEDPSVAPTTIFVSDIVPIPISEVEGLTDSYTTTDPNGSELPPSLTFSNVFPNAGLPFEGGTLCTLTGTNLNLVKEIRIAGSVVPFVYVNATTLQVTTPVSPDNSAGVKNVDMFDAFLVLQASQTITYDPQVSVFGLSNVLPNTGSTLGGEEIVLNGAAIFFIASVTIGDEPVFDFRILNSTSMRIVTPPGLIGPPVDIRVTSYDGSVAILPNAFTYTYPPPFLLGADKNSGDIAGGTEVILAGAYLQDATDVQIDGISVGAFTVINGKTIVFQTGPSVFTGLALDITVVAPIGFSTLFGAFTYSTIAPVPKITNVSPPTGIIGTFPTVTINGSGFTGTVQVEFENVAASSFTVVTDKIITCTTPFGSYNSRIAVPVKVATMDGEFTRIGAYTFVYDKPTVTSTTLTTDLVEGGANGTVFGTNFYDVTAVTIAGVPVRSYTVVSPTQIDYVTGTSPNDTNPPGDIKVITVFGIGTLTGVFTYTYPVVTVTNTSVNAGFASGGSTIVLTGMGFTLVTQVLISGIAAATFTVDSLTQITCITAADANPTNLPNNIVVQTIFSEAVLPNSFTYFATMTLASSSISNGVTSGGELGTLTGSNFANVQNLFIAGQAVSSFTVVNSTTITFVTGAANTYGVLGSIVILTTFGENVILPNAFIYYPTLIVSSVNSDQGLSTGGQTRTLVGTGFYSVTSVTVCGVNVTSFTTITPTSLSFVIAPNPTLGTGDIVVTTTYTSYTFTNGFTYFPVMQVSSINVSSGPATGGTTVVITGSGFFQVNSVKLNATEVVSFTIDSLTQITCVTGSKSLLDGETGDVVVTSPYTSNTLSNVWTYWPTMSVVSLDVTNGPTTGGTTVVVTGSGFYAVTSITFNNISVASYTVDSPSQITILTGIGALNGTGNVVVNSIYTSATKSNAWTYYQPMSVSTLSVANGSTVGGTSVVITGAGFYSVNSVTFNGVNVTSYTVNSLTQITVTTASKVSNGDVGNVVVSSTYTSATKSSAWTYWPPMSVGSLSVSNGSTIGGTSVVITGMGFYDISSVAFNGVSVASFTVNSVTQITVSTGVGTVNGTGNVVVTSSFTNATGTNMWTYWQPVVVTSLDVSNGPRAGGTAVVVTGSGFYSVSGMTFNGVAVTSYTVNSLTQITVVTGDKLASNGDVGAVVVTTTYTSGSKSNAWTYYPPMTVTSLDVSNGPKAGGTTVVITGAGFYSVSGVTFNGTAVTSYTVDSATQITVVTGAKPSSTGELGNVIVTSNFTSATGTNLWTYYAPIVVSSLNVTNGPRAGGTTVVVTGSGFYSVSGITFNGVAVSSYTVDSLTQITVQTGAKVSSNGDVGNVVVTTAFTSGTGTNLWTYYPPMSFTSLNVSNGSSAGGTAVVITGAGFYSVSGVTFNGTAVTSYTVDSVTQITVSTGVSSATSPTLGNVIVTSAYTSATGTNVWTYYPPIVVSSLDVSYGNVSGGTTVNITGSGFYNVNSVTFKGIEVRSKTINSPTSISVVVKGDVTQLMGRNSYLGTSPPTSNFTAASTFHCWAGGSIQKFIVPGTYVYTSKDAVTFTVADVPTPSQLRYAMYVPSLSKAYVVGNGNFADRFLESSDGITWTSPGVLPINRSWNWMAYSPTLDVFVVVDRQSTAIATPIAVSTNRGATWTQYGTGTSRSFSTVVWCTAMGKFVANGFSTVSPGIIAYSSDGITWAEVNLGALFPTANVTFVQSVGVSEDLGIVQFISTGNSFVSSDGINWQMSTSGGVNSPIWIESLQLFVGVRSGVAYSYSPDGLVWTDVAVNNTNVITYGSLAYSPEQDAFLAGNSSGSTSTSWNFTNPNISTNASVVVTSTYTTGTKANAWAFVPTMAISDVDIGYGPTTGGTVVKLYGRGFRDVTSISFGGVQATTFTVDSFGCLITATTAAGTAGTGDIVCANSSRTATLTNGWSYKNTTTSSYTLDTLSSGALASVQVVLNTKPMRSTYSGPLFRVWRGSDGAVTDVYGTSGNPADWFTKNGTLLSSFKGAATLRVVRWFDQSGNATGTDGAIPKPPNSGPVFAYAYQPRYMPTLDLTNNCLDFSGGSRYLQMQDGVTTSGDVSHTFTVRHGTTGNSVQGEYFSIGAVNTTPPGSGNYLRRSGSNYVNTWPGNNTLTLAGAYVDNQTITVIYDQSGLLRTGYVQGVSAGTSVVTTAFTGNNTLPFIGGRGAGTEDSLAQIFHVHVAASAMNSSDRSVFEEVVVSSPFISSIDVPSGTTTGGTTVVITGTGFTGATTVSFNGTNATSMVVNSATQITAVTAAGSAGRGNIVVTTSVGTDTFTNGWTYFQTNYTRFFAVTDISTTTGLNKTGSSLLTTVVYSSALNLFVVADSQSGIAQPYVTSPDAVTWTRRNATAQSGNDTINDIAASPTAIVSVGQFPVIRRSTNATSWTTVTSTNTLTFRIAYSPSLSRWAVGRGNNSGLYYSNDDGATWSAATGAAVHVANVTWNSGSSEFYVFMRSGGSVYRSSNGTSYTLAASSLASDNYHAAAYSSDRGEMMTIGNGGGRIYTSTDGTTWTLKGTITSTSIVGVTWSSDLYVYVICTNKGLYTSVDGTAWVAMNPLTWSGTFDFSWGRWVYNSTARKGVAAYVNTVFRTEDTQRASLSFAASQNVQVTNDADLRPGAGDFTVEWFQFQNTPTAGTTPYVFSIGNDLAVTVNGTSNVMSVFVGGSAVITNTPTNVYGRWCHFAMTRTGTTLGLFKDGNRLATVTNSTNITNSTDVLRIANSSTTAGNNQFLGRITNFHFVKGTALYTTATYTVPTREIFPVANTKLFLPTPTGDLVRNYCLTTKTITNNSATSSTYNPFYL